MKEIRTSTQYSIIALVVIAVGSVLYLLTSGYYSTTVIYNSTAHTNTTTKLWHSYVSFAFLFSKYWHPIVMLIVTLILVAVILIVLMTIIRRMR